MQRGYSFVELIVVFSILAIVTAVVVPRLGTSIAARELDDAAQRLAADIRWTQQIVLNSPQNSLPRVTFFNAEPFGYIIRANTKAIKPLVVFPASVVLTGNPGELTFKVNGFPDRTMDLTVNMKSTVTGKSRKVVVQMITGRVRVEVVK